MFPDKSGGVAIYANEGWRKYTTLVGPVATFGYWIGWSVVLVVPRALHRLHRPGRVVPRTSRTARTRSAARRSTTATSRPARVHVGLQHLIAIGLILAVWVFNFFGTRDRRDVQLPGRRSAHGPALLLHVPAVHQRRLRLRQPHLQAQRRRSRLGRLAARARLDLDHDLVDRRPKPAATFAPEYKDTVRDTRKALLSSALFILIVNTLVPIGSHRRSRREDRGGVRLRRALNKLVGPGATNFFVVVICRELHHLDEHGDRRRQPCALRHLEGRHDDQAARAAEPLQRARERDVARHGHQHPLRPLRRQPVRHPRREQHRLRAREHLRDRGVRPAAEGPAELAATDQAPVLLDADRRGPLRGCSSSSAIVGFGWFQIAGGGASTAARRRRSSASASSPSRCSSSCSGGSSRTARRRTGARRRRRCRTRASQSLSRRRWPRSRSRMLGSGGGPAASRRLGQNPPWKRPGPRNSRSRWRAPRSQAPEAFGASFDVAPASERSSSARASRAIRRSPSAGRSGCSRPA